MKPLCLSLTGGLGWLRDNLPFHPRYGSPVILVPRANASLASLRNEAALSDKILQVGSLGISWNKWRHRLTKWYYCRKQRHLGGSDLVRCHTHHDSEDWWLWLVMQFGASWIMDDRTMDDRIMDGTVLLLSTCRVALPFGVPRMRVRRTAQSPVSSEAAYWQSGPRLPRTS